MRIVGLILLMLVVFLGTNTWLLSYGLYWSWRDVQFAFALTVFFGTIVAVPVILLLFLFDFVATRWRFPFSAIIYVALSVFCCAAVAFFVERAKDRHTPTTVREWLAALVEFSPVLTTACVLLVRQFYRAATGWKPVGP